jgi:superkiller protein 3
LKGQGKIEEAIACYKKAIELDPKFAVAHTNLGIALHAQGKLDEATACYKKAIELDPNDAGLHYNLGVFLRDQKKLDEAIACLRKAIGLDPKYALATTNLSSALQAKGLQLVENPDPKLRDPKRAVEFAKEAVELTPNSLMAWDNLGRIKYRAGQWKESVEAFEKCIELSKSGQGYVSFFLAMAHWKLGNKVAARKWYDQAVAWMEKNQPKNEELRRFRAEATELLGIEMKKD